MILLGNKVDLLMDERAMSELRANGQTHVSTQEGKDLADEYGVLHFETSAKDNTNVDEAFGAIAKATMERMVTREQPHKDTHRLIETPQPTQNKRCC